MIVLHKKKIFLAIYIVSIAFILAIVLITNNNHILQPAMAWPIPEKTVILDAGHGLPDERSSTG